MNLLKVLTDKMEWLENREDRALWVCMGGHAGRSMAPPKFLNFPLEYIKKRHRPLQELNPTPPNYFQQPVQYNFK